MNRNLYKEDGARVAVLEGLEMYGEDLEGYGYEGLDGYGSDLGSIIPSAADVKDFATNGALLVGGVMLMGFAEKLVRKHLNVPQAAIPVVHLVVGYGLAKAVAMINPIAGMAVGAAAAFLGIMRAGQIWLGYKQMGLSGYAADDLDGYLDGDPEGDLGGYGEDLDGYVTASVAGY